MTASPGPLTPDPALGRLSRVHERLGRHRLTRQLLGRPPLTSLGRRHLRRLVPAVEPGLGGEGVTVVIGVRDRSDHRLANALRSIRDQADLGESVEIVVVDYASRDEHVPCIVAQCERYAATLVRIDEAPGWSRSRCLNAGLGRVRTPVVVLSDVDIVFSSAYLAAALRRLSESSPSVVAAPMHDLPEASDRALRAAAAGGAELPLDEWRHRCGVRLEWPVHPSILVGPTALFRLIGGYDEYFEVWGSEDEDLLRRLRRLGVRVVPVGDDAFYLHQWHPKFEGVPGGEEAAQIERNRIHEHRTHSLLRNQGGEPGSGSPSSRTVR